MYTHAPYIRREISFWDLSKIVPSLFDIICIWLYLFYICPSSSFYRKIWIYPYILILILIHNLTKEYKKKNLNFENSVLVYRIIQYYFLIYIIQVSLRGFFYIWTMHIFCMVKRSRIDVYWVSRVIYNLWILTHGFVCGFSCHLLCSSFDKCPMWSICSFSPRGQWKRSSA